MSSVVRGLVSKHKRRTVDKTVPSGAVDLDLTQIHARVVCMAFPATGLRALYRNAYKDVLHYLDFKFGNNYVVYNLCEESAYQYSTSRFHGRVRAFPFRDHHACPLQRIVDFVHDASAYLREHDNSVVVIHCKAGKGRTGVLACCLLLCVDDSFARSAQDVMRYYGEQRTHDGHGLTVPSQRRCVMYYEQLLRLYGGVVPRRSLFALRLRSLRLRDVPRRVRVNRVRIVLHASTTPTRMTRDGSLGVDADGDTKRARDVCTTCAAVRAATTTTAPCLCTLPCHGGGDGVAYKDDTHSNNNNMQHYSNSDKAASMTVIDVRLGTDVERSHCIANSSSSSAAVAATATATAATAVAATTTTTATVAGSRSDSVPTAAMCASTSAAVAPTTSTALSSSSSSSALFVTYAVTGGVQEGTDLLTYDIALCFDHEPRLHDVAGDMRIEFCRGDTLLGALSLHTLFMRRCYTRDDVDMLCRRLYHDERFTIELDYVPHDHVSPGDAQHHTP